MSTREDVFGGTALATDTDRIEKLRDYILFERKVQRLMWPSREMQRLMRASPLMQAYAAADAAEIKHSPNKQPAPLPPNEQPAPPPPKRQRKRRHGPLPKHDREPLWQLFEQSGRTAKELAADYEAKTKTKVSTSWAQKNKRRPR
jgi:hypothetical protein